MNRAIISDEYPEFADALRQNSFDVISSESIDCFIPYERRHADMQCLIINDAAFILSRCKRLISELESSYSVIPCGDSVGGEYPLNVPLNAAVIGKYVLARLNSLDPKVMDHCSTSGFELINVNQGYAKCSCAVVSDNAIITADKGIYNSVKELNIDVLLIEEGRVRLAGADHGFIGGASGLRWDDSGRTLYFCGDITRHPDYMSIKAFCKNHDTGIISLTDSELTDVGGIVFC